jgi:hypothetical protein
MVKSEKSRRQPLIQRQGCPITRSSPERILIEKSVPVDQSLSIPLKAFGKGEEEMAKGGDNRMLVMGITGHESGSIHLPSFEKDANQARQPFNESQNLIPEIKAHIQDDLIIAASSRMDLPSRFDADPIDNERFNIGMNILFGGI